MLGLTECKCTKCVNRNGFGICGKEDDDFGGSVTCYVVHPSSCTDTIVSNTDPEKLRSAEACLTGNIFLYVYSDQI